METSKNILEIKTKIKSLRLMNADEVTNFGHSKLEDICKNKGFKSLLSKKAIAFFKDKVFTSELKDGSLVSYKCFIKDKKFLTFSSILYSIKTSGGIVYVLPNFQGDYQTYQSSFFTGDFTCWTAHFFDRYNERMSLEFKNGIRKRTIKSFIQECLAKNLALEYERKEKDGTDIYSFCGDGLMCGEIAENIVLNITFLSEEMLNEKQKKIFERLKDKSVTI